MATPRTSAAGGASRLPRPRSSTSGSSSSDRLAAVPHAAQPQLRRPPLTLPLPLPLPANDSDASENEDEHDDSPAASPGERPLMVSRRVATATFALPAHEATDAADGDVGGGHQDQDRDDDAADEPQLEAFAEPEPQLLSTSSIAALAPMPLPPQQPPPSTSAPVALAASPPPPQPIVMASSVVPPLPPPQSAAPLFSEYGVLADMPLYGIAAVDDEVYVNMSRSGQDSHPRRHRSHSHSHSHSHPHRGAYEVCRP